METKLCVSFTNIEKNNIIYKLVLTIYPTSGNDV